MKKIFNVKIFNLERGNENEIGLENSLATKLIYTTKNGW